MEPIKKEQIETPALLIDLDILESNITTMGDFLKDKKAKLRPHYKSYKCPTISHKQIAAGAKGITCSKIGEAETLVNAGLDSLEKIASSSVEKLIKVNGIGEKKAKTLIESAKELCS